MKKSLVTIILLASSAIANADDLKLPKTLAAYRKSLVHAFLTGYFFTVDSQIPGEGRPTYSISLTRDPGKTGDTYVYKFARTAPDGICGGIIYQNVAGSNDMATTDCKLK